MRIISSFLVSILVSLAATAAPQIEFDIVTEVPPIVQSAMSQYLYAHCGDFLSQAQNLTILETFTAAGTEVSDDLTQSQYRTFISIDYRPVNSSVNRATGVFMETAYYQYADGRTVIKPYVHTWPDICKVAKK